MSPKEASLEALATEISVICAEWAVAVKSGLLDQAAFQQLMQPHILTRLKWHAQVEEYRRLGLVSSEYRQETVSR